VGQSLADRGELSTDKPLMSELPDLPDQPGLDTARLHAEYEHDLRLFLTGVLRDADLAQDALQTVFQKALEQGHTVRQETIRGWLFQVAFREALQIRRRNSALKRVETRWLKQTIEQSATDAKDAGLQALITREDLQKVQDALRQLPHDQQFVVRARLEKEQTFAMIAAELQVPLGTVLTRMRLALEKIRKRLTTDLTEP